MDEVVKPKPGRATIKDVANAAGVSAMTVSNVLNGRLQYVSPATKKRVEREISRLNYRRQANARNLRVAQQRSIGMVIVDESPFFLADNFTCQVVAGLANVLNRADYTLTVQGMRKDQLADFDDHAQFRGRRLLRDDFRSARGAPRRGVAARRPAATGDHFPGGG